MKERGQTLDVGMLSLGSYKGDDKPSNLSTYYLRKNARHNSIIPR
jgi:hypothetical protein